MKFKVTYTEEIEADSRKEAIEMLLSKNNKLDRHGNIKAEPLCPKGKDKSKSCYEHCVFRENGACELDFKV